MTITIRDWQDISKDFSDSILLGNGASISINDSFTYKSLKEHAANKGLFDPSIKVLFDFFRTDDFELILRLVWHATKVNESLGITDNKTQKAYEHVRDSLINAVQSIHPEHNSVQNQFPAIANFLSSFKTVLSLNYDLTLYWIMMYAQDIDNGHKFKDCIIHNVFRSDWEGLRQSAHFKYPRTTLVFYPHGSLILARDITEREHKLVAQDDEVLLESILKHWKSGAYIPLFVSEGTSDQKAAAIGNSHYLNIVYREVIPSIDKNLTIYGWGFGEEDTHILEKIGSSNVEKIAVSVYGDDQTYCDRVVSMIRRNIKKDVEVIFFNSESDGCWNN